MLNKIDIKSFLNQSTLLHENLTPGNLDSQSKNSICWLKTSKYLMILTGIEVGKI